MGSPGPAPGISAAEILHTSPDLDPKPPLYTTGQGPYNNNNEDLELRYGTLCSIAGSTESGKTLLGLHAITTHLLTHPTSSVAWIDTVGGFSALWLKGIIERRIVETRNRAFADGEGFGGEDVVSSGIGEAEMQKMVEGVLDRVLVMRVFDWWGVVEAVGEVKTCIEKQYRKGKSGSVGESWNGDGDGDGNRNRENVEVPMQSQEQGIMPESSPLSSPPPSSQLVTPSPPPHKVFPLAGGKSEISDSDAETDDEEIIYSPSPPRSPSLPPQTQPQSSDDENDLPIFPSYSNARGNTEIHLDSDNAISPSSPKKQSHPAVGLLVIDTITFPIETMINRASSSSMRAAPSTAPGAEAIVQIKVAEVYALIGRYFREVGEWAGECGMGVLLLNTTTTSSDFSHPKIPSPTPSPSLGPFFQHILDMSIVLSSLPTYPPATATTNPSSRGRNRGRGVRGGSRGRGRGRGGQIEDNEGSLQELLIGYKILHDRRGEMSGWEGVVRVGI